MASKAAMSRLLASRQRSIIRSRQSASEIVKKTTRSFSSSSSSNNEATFSSYQYPMRTEAPEVKRTTAEEAAAVAAAAPPSPMDASKIQSRLYYSQEDTDRFDDLAQMTPEQRDRAKQLPPDKYKLTGATPIEATAPAHIPPNFPAKELKVPTTEITTLPNGVRVVSQETYGQVSTIGVVADVGSRHEPQLGVAHLWELVAFSSTRDYSSALEVHEVLQDWGGTRFVNSGREQSLVCIDILRPNVEKGMKMLQQVLLYPQFKPEEVEDAKRTMEFQALDLPPELIMEEALQAAAYGSDQQLGKPHFCPLDHLNDLNADVLRDFWNNNVLANPQDIVVGGAGIGHEQLVQLTEEYFGDWVKSSALEHHEGLRTIPSKYRGGKSVVEKKLIDGYTRVALAFELDGWHSEALVPTCVLQTLLGGGNSFSAGGPGKGMYSRLYRQVLNRYAWADSAEAFTSIHAESGLWGITGSSKPERSREMVEVLAEQIALLSLEQVSDEEFDRARNMLKCNVLTQLESRLVLFEDLGRQVLTYGLREDMDTTCQKIDAVTKEELQVLAKKAIKTPPTLAAVGEISLSNIPSQEEVKQWFAAM